eukprot:m51a1_g7991 putative protein phosphatase (449) ;mRNA; r:99940-102784
MFGLCHGLYQCATQKTEYKVLVIGLDGAGKTTLLERIKAMYSTRPPLPPHNIRPTVGLNIGRVEMGKLKLVLWDLGGVVQLRVIWPKYFREAQGIIYVVDSNNPGRFEESRLELEEALASPDVALETPVLVLANKQDEPEACGVSVVEAALRIEQADRPHINIQPVVAHTGTKKQPPAPKSGHESQQGRRMTMEDTHVAIDDAKGKGDLNRAFYGVYDGHGGRQAAEVAKQVLHDLILKDPALESPADEGRVMEAVMNGFKKTDEIILKRSKAEGWNDGATAVCALLLGPKMYVANLGDAEIVVPSRGREGLTVECVSEKHKPSSPRERQRVEQAGGHVIFGRILGSLAVSRSFGDSEFKYPQNRGTDDFVSCVPHVTTVTLTPETQFFILACDGLWDKMSYEEAVRLCDEQKSAGKTPQEAAQFLVKRALDNGTLDNVTCVVVYLTW